MKDILIKQAVQNLENFEERNLDIDYCLKEIKAVDLNKESAAQDFAGSPNFQNIINILGPYAVYYKIDQVLKLLKEFGGEFTKKGPYYPRINV